MGLVRGDHTLDLGRVEREVVRPFAFDHGRAGHPGDLGMHLVGRLERGHDTSRPGVGEQHRLQHLVGAVGDEDLRCIDAVRAGDRLAEFGRSPVGIAVPVDPGDLRSHGISERRRRRFGRFVGVQPDPDVDLCGVVPLEGAQVVTDGNHRAKCRGRAPSPPGRVWRHGRIHRVDRRRVGSDRRQRGAVPQSGRRTRRALDRDRPRRHRQRRPRSRTAAPQRRTHA